MAELSLPFLPEYSQAIADAISQNCSSLYASLKMLSLLRD